MYYTLCVTEWGRAASAREHKSPRSRGDRESTSTAKFALSQHPLSSMGRRWTNLPYKSCYFKFAFVIGGGVFI